MIYPASDSYHVRERAYLGLMFPRVLVSKKSGVVLARARQFTDIRLDQNNGLLDFSNVLFFVERWLTC